MLNFEKLMKYYNDDDNINSIIQFLEHRETALIVSKGYPEQNQRSCRNIRLESVRDFKWWILRWSGFADKVTMYNLYHSMAIYKYGIPRLPSRYVERKPLQQQWAINHWKQIEDYDCLIDIDAPTHELMPMAKEDAIKIMQYLDDKKYKYQIRFSGCGFHFIIPSEEFNNDDFDPYSTNSVYDDMRKLVQHLYDNYTEFIDTGVIDSRRVCKIPNTIAIYHQKTYMCKVLKKEQLENFELKDYEW